MHLPPVCHARGRAALLFLNLKEYWKYYRIKDGKETPEKMDYSFYICIWTDMEGNMEEADINVVVANTDIIEDAEPWGYSFF